MSTHQAPGFTLIEIMIVLAVIGILAAIAIPQFAAYRTRAQDAAAEHALHALAKAQEDYYSQFETYTRVRSNLAASNQWTVEPQVVITLEAADADSWSGLASHQASSNVFTYTSSGGGLQ